MASIFDTKITKRVDDALKTMNEGVQLQSDILERLDRIIELLEANSQAK